MVDLLHESLNAYADRTWLNLACWHPICGVVIQKQALVTEARLSNRYTPGSATSNLAQGPDAPPPSDAVAREALKFVLSPSGTFFRDFLMTELVQSFDALSRQQASSRAIPGSASTPTDLRCYTWNHLLPLKAGITQCLACRALCFPSALTHMPFPHGNTQLHTEINKRSTHR